MNDFVKEKSGYTGKGIVFNIQRWAIQDGPGMRTTIFLKGCPLNCGWCANPESQRSHPEIMTRNILCIGCAKCKEVCPLEAISIVESPSEETVYSSMRQTSCQAQSAVLSDESGNGLADSGREVKIKKEIARNINWSLCNDCLKCAEVCPAKAIIISGEEKTVDEVMKVVLKDMSFYRRTKGGLTISGGEPLMQWRFTLDLLKSARKRGIHTALDTTGFGSWAILEELLEYTNLLLYDVKHTDSSKHKAATGAGNELILENLRKAVKKCTVWIRRVVIPGFNDSDAETEALAQLVTSLDPLPAKLSLLPYHKFAESKYESIGMTYTYSHVEPLLAEKIKELKKVMESLCGIKVDIGK